MREAPIWRSGKRPHRQLLMIRHLFMVNPGLFDFHAPQLEAKLTNLSSIETSAFRSKLKVNARTAASARDPSSTFSRLIGPSLRPGCAGFLQLFHAGRPRRKCHRHHRKC